MTKRRLSQDERIEIQALVRQGAPRDQIAEQFGISVSHVYELGRKGRQIQRGAEEATLPVGVRIEYKAAGHLVVHTASRDATRATFTVGADAFTTVARALQSTRTVARGEFNEEALQETSARCVRLVRRWQGAQQLDIELKVVTARATINESISPSWVLYLLLRDAFNGTRVRVTRQPFPVEEDETARDSRFREMLAELDEVTHLEDG